MGHPPFDVLTASNSPDEDGAPVCGLTKSSSGMGTVVRKIVAAVCTLGLLLIAGCGADKPGLTLSLSPSSLTIQIAVNQPVNEVGIMNVFRSDGGSLAGLSVTNSNTSCMVTGPEIGASGASIISRCIPNPGQCSSTITASVAGAQAVGQVTCEVVPGG